MKLQTSFSVHCLMCGKDFQPDTTRTCGGEVDGKKLCDKQVLVKELALRLGVKKQKGMK